MTQKLDLNGLNQLAKEFAQKIKQQASPRVLALTGELGSGKTTFVSYLAQALGVEKRVLSPTFVVTRHYSFSQEGKTRTLYHTDLYRLDESNIGLLGLEEMIADDSGVLVIEWADRAKSILPKDTIWLNFTYIDPHMRGVEIH